MSEESTVEPGAQSEGYPDLDVITVVWDGETGDLNISYDEDRINVYEAIGLLRMAFRKVERQTLYEIEGEEDDED